jgi:hypothetical protein
MDIENGDVLDLDDTHCEVSRGRARVHVLGVVPTGPGKNVLVGQGHA